VTEEIAVNTRYRRVRPDWTSYSKDFEGTECFGYKKAELFAVLKNYFSRQGLEMNWDILAEAPDEKIISALSMICPLEASEKQALLEAEDCRTRGQLLQTMLEIEIYKQLT
jgi:hypothetical protein